MESVDARGLKRKAGEELNLQQPFVSDSSSSLLRLILVDVNKDVCKALEKAFLEFKTVAVHNKRFEELDSFDCLVSAGNRYSSICAEVQPVHSFGLMDGGVDKHITNFFGGELQQRVQKNILDKYGGEQPVGTSFIVPTGHSKIPYLAHTPTMRIPTSIQATDNVYNAMRAMLHAVEDFNKDDKKIKSIACTGLGTFYGKMEYEEAARQMALAYKNFLNRPKTISWDFAFARQKEIQFGGYDDFVIYYTRQNPPKKIVWKPEQQKK